MKGFTLPHHKSCKKRMKTSDKERLRNRGIRSVLRNAIKELRNATGKDEALSKYNNVTSLLDKAATYGIIHKKNASRNKSRLAHFVQKLG